MSIKNVCIASGILLIIAIPSIWPYGFYTLLRVSIFVSSIYVAYRHYQLGATQWSLVFGAIAFIFNPIIPVYLSKDTWVIIDLITALLFFGVSRHGEA